MKKRLFLGIGCIATAFLLAFVVSPLLQVLSVRTVTVIRARSDLPRGHLISESDVETVTVSAEHLPSGILTGTQEAVGLYTSCEIRAGQDLLQTHVMTEGESASDVFSTLDGTQQAISVTIGTYAAGLSGKLENGDIVSVLSYRDGVAELPPELTYVKVITSTTEEGIDQDELTPEADGSKEKPVTVTLLVNTEQAKLLVQLEHSGSLHIELVYRGDTETSNQFLKEQEAYFTKEDSYE